MSLLGKAAVVIWCQAEPAIRAEHDAWHSGEHLPERMAIPGFLRGRRTVAVDPAAPWQYFILYEVEDVSVMTVGCLSRALEQSHALVAKDTGRLPLEPHALPGRVKPRRGSRRAPGDREVGER